MLGVEGEIAKRIAESLQAKLTGQEQRALAFRPTTNPEAYDAYLRGRALDARYSEEEVLKASRFFEQAVRRDPNFAAAWARLSRAEASLYYNGQGKNAAVQARQALEHAQKLEPNSPETLLALGYYQYEVLYDRGLANITLRRVSEMLPGNSEVLQALGKISRRDGKWNESFADFAQALALDPRNVQLLTEPAFSYDMLRQFPAALDLYDRALEITPNDTDIIASKASIYQAEGDLGQAATLLVGINDLTVSEDTFAIKITQLKLERKYGEAVRSLQARLAQFHFASQYDKAHDQVTLALIERLAGDTAAAKLAAQQAHDTFEAFGKEQSDDIGILADLALPTALFADKALALKQAGYFLTLPATNNQVAAKDWTAWGTFEENLALVQTLVGEKNDAISMLTHLSQLAYRGRIYVNVSITPALLRLDPIWDSLRGYPAFQKLCEEPKKPVALK
jgi:tetratricopeptide (TPR) repeat protein